jgi:hypothetical protein
VGHEAGVHQRRLDRVIGAQGRHDRQVQIAAGDLGNFIERDHVCLPASCSATVPFRRAIASERARFTSVAGADRDR